MPPEIYIVDDDASVRRAMERLIRSAGMKVRTFASAQEFLDFETVSQNACMIVDITLQGMSGLELQKELRTRGSHLPVIFITGFDSPEKAATAFLDDGCGTAVIKLGEKGCYLRSSEEEIFVPAQKVKVFDAVGAGDTFNAGFIFGTLQGWPLKARMVFGTATSAQYIAKSTDRFPSLEDSVQLASRIDTYTFIQKE